MAGIIARFRWIHIIQLAVLLLLRWIPIAAVRESDITVHPMCAPTSQPTLQPSQLPSRDPTMQPTARTVAVPSIAPSICPSVQPSSKPSDQPKESPTNKPSSIPTSQPSESPSSSFPSLQPTAIPSEQPSNHPTMQPTVQPSQQQTVVPSLQPSSQPTSIPSFIPSGQPTEAPTLAPAAYPTVQPTEQPATTPSSEPTLRPSAQPSLRPSPQPSTVPSGLPTSQPQCFPTSQPSSQPTAAPTRQPSNLPTSQPSHQPSSGPSIAPTALPSTGPSSCPSQQPTQKPSAQPSTAPSNQPTSEPSQQSTSAPSRSPSSLPSEQPIAAPSLQPSNVPSATPSRQPTLLPSSQPSLRPSDQPIATPSSSPSSRPSRQPTNVPTAAPSSVPTQQPTTQPIALPSSSPSQQPTAQPAAFPSSAPSGTPTVQPSALPSSSPSALPSHQPTSQPVAEPTSAPSKQPTQQPAAAPTSLPSCVPSAQPTSQPTSLPSQPSSQPSSAPSLQPTSAPSRQPSVIPSQQPTDVPTAQPSSPPTMQPSLQSSAAPSVQPTSCPSAQPSTTPSRQPTNLPTSLPSGQTSCNPSQQPSSSPSTRPSSCPTACPSGQPSSIPSSSAPTTVPTSCPTKFPSTSSPTSPGETNAPSDVPTAGPSFDLDFNSDSIYLAYEEKRARYQIVSSSFSYGSFYFKGLEVDGSCKEWSEFVDDEILLPTEEFRFTSLVFDGAYFDYEKQVSRSIVAQCSDAQIVQNIVASLQSRSTYSVDCGGRLWRIFPCGGQPVICVNCKLNCVATEACPGRAFVINGCGSSCDFHAIASSVLQLQYESTNLYPRFAAPLRVTANRTVVSVVVEITGAGNVYCAAFTTAQVLNDITSVSDIADSGVQRVLSTVDAATASLQIQMPLSGLSPSTTYYVICYTADFFGHAMPLEEALRYNVSVQTDCCRAIEAVQTHALVAQFVAASSRPESIFSIALNSQPTESVILSFTQALVSCSTATAVAAAAVEPIIRPAEFAFGSDSKSLRAEFTVRGSVVGCYSITAYAAGSTLSYEPLSISYSLVSFRTAPLLPQLTSVVLSDNLVRLLFNFDTNTDQGETVVSAGTEMFTCSRLVQFSGAAASTCKWINATQLAADFSAIAEADFPAVGATAAVRGAVLRAQCVTTDLCASYEFIPATVATVAAPVNPAKIVALLSSSPVVALGDSLVLDPTASAGAGSRRWSSLKWEVASLNFPAAALAIAAALNANYPDTSQRAEVAVALLPTAPATFTFTLRLSNFLQREAAASATVSTRTAAAVASTTAALTPRVDVFIATRNIYRWQMLRVEANATVPGFVGNSSALPLSFTWRVYEGVAFRSAIQSISKSPRVFKLAPFTLKAATNYTLVLTVAQQQQQQQQVMIAPVSVSTSFAVGRAAVRAVIAGQPATTAQFSEDILLDAAASYDVDFPDDSSLLSFVWSCVSYSPQYGNTCPGFSSATATTTAVVVVTTTGSVLTIPAALLPASVTYEIKVTVANALGRSDTAQLLLSVRNQRLPVVSVIPVSRKVDSRRKLILSAEISSITVGDVVNVQWSSPSFNSLTAQGVALSPVAKRITAPAAGSSSSSSSTFQLAIAANSLTAGLSYIFELNAAFVDSPNQFSTATVAVAVNSPPAGGELLVSPLQGVGIYSAFTFSTSRWSDDSADLPLSFSFAYFIAAAATDADAAETGVAADLLQLLLLVKPTSVVPYATASVGQGISALDYAVTAVATASDIYDSAASLQQQLTVRQPSVILSELLDAVADRIDIALHNQDAVLLLQLAQAALQRMNAVDCFVPYQCASINRRHCSTTPRTCGTCLDGFIGVFGDSNIACNRSETLRPVGASCSANIDCITGSCISSSSTSSRCVDVLKSCPNDCGSDGSCGFFNSAGAAVATCFVSDISCRAKCICSSNRFGKDCSIRGFDYRKLSTAREEMCLSLRASLSYQDVSEDVVQSRAVTVASILVDIDQISDAAISDCASVLVDTISGDSVLSCQGAGFELFVSALSNVVEKGAELPDGLLVNVTAALTELTVGCLEDSAVGESSQNGAVSNVRVTTVLIDGATATNATLEAPQTDFEAFNGIESSVVQIGTSGSSGDDDSSAASYGVTVIQYNNNPHGSVLTNSSSVVVETVAFSSSGSSSSNRRAVRRKLQDNFPTSSIGVTVTLVNTEPIDYDELAVEVLQVRCFELKDHDYTMRRTCPGGEQLLVTCPAGFKGVKELRCPGFRTVPRCTMWDGAEFIVNPDCEVLDFTAETTTCFCPATAATTAAASIAAAGRRQLQSSREIREFSSRFAVVASDVGTTYSRAPPIEEVEKNLVILITLSTILGMYVAGLVWFVYWDYHIRTTPSKGVSDSFKYLYRGKKNRTIKGFFEAIFPAEFQTETWYVLLWKRLLAEHSFISLFAPYDRSSDAHFVRWSIAMGRLVVFLFVNSLVARVMYADDGYCEGFEDAGDCEDAETTGGYFKACSWNKDNESCSFRRPEITFVTSIMLTLIVAVLSVPMRSVLRIMMDYIYGFMHRSALRKSHASVHVEPVLPANSTAIGGPGYEEEEVFDEFVDSVTQKGILLRAARLEKCRKTIDFILPSDEAKLVNLQLQVSQVRQENHRVFANTVEHSQLQHSRYGQGLHSLHSIERRINSARAKSGLIKAELEVLPSDEEKERYLMRNFLVDIFQGAHRRLLASYMLGASEVRSQSTFNTIMEYSCLILLPCIMLAMIYGVYAWSLRIGSRSTNLWLLITLLSFAQDAGALQPMRIWLKWVVINGIIAEDVHHMIERMIRQSRLALMRTQGLMRNANSMVQHFNPACRVARMFPSLPVSRLLLSLNDPDVPSPEQRSFLRQPYLFLLSFVVTVAFLPEILQDPALEMFSSSLIDFGLLGFFALGQTNSVAAALLAGTVIVSFIVWQSCIISQEQKMRRLKFRSTNQTIFAELDLMDQQRKEEDQIPLEMMRTKPTAMDAESKSSRKELPPMGQQHQLRLSMSSRAVAAISDDEFDFGADRVVAVGRSSSSLDKESSPNRAIRLPPLSLSPSRASPFGSTYEMPIGAAMSMDDLGRENSQEKLYLRPLPPVHGPPLSSAVERVFGGAIPADDAVTVGATASGGFVQSHQASRRTGGFDQHVQLASQRLRPASAANARDALRLAAQEQSFSSAADRQQREQRRGPGDGGSSNGNIWQSARPVSAGGNLSAVSAVPAPALRGTSTGRISARRRSSRSVNNRPDSATDALDHAGSDNGSFGPGALVQQLQLMEAEGGTQRTSSANLIMMPPNGGSPQQPMFVLPVSRGGSPVKESRPASGRFNVAAAPGIAVSGPGSASFRQLQQQQLQQQRGESASSGRSTKFPMFSD